MDKLKTLFSQLNAREKLLVTFCAVFVIIGLFYWLIWQPLDQAVENGRKNLASQQALLTWVKNNSERAIQLRQTAGISNSFTGSLPQAVNQSAARLQIKISRMQPQADELQVWIDKAEFNTLLSWLQTLEKSGVSVLDLDIAEADEAGYIKVRRLKLGKA